MKWYQYSLSCHAHSKSTNDSTRPHTASVSIPVFLGYGNGTTCPKIALPSMLRVLVYFSCAYIIQALATVRGSTKNCFLQSCYMSIVPTCLLSFKIKFTPLCVLAPEDAGKQSNTPTKYNLYCQWYQICRALPTPYCKWHKSWVRTCSWKWG